VAPPLPPLWLLLLSAPESADLAVVQADAAAYKHEGLVKLQRHAEFVAAANGGAPKERTGKLERLRTAFYTYLRLCPRDNVRLRKTEKSVIARKPAAATVGAVGAAAEAGTPLWLCFLGNEKRAEFMRTLLGAMWYQQEGLTMLQRRKQYLVQPDLTGERARTHEQLRATY
jgi:hypothetical protein